MQPKRFTFVMEQTLGHIPFAQNLRKTFDNAGEEVSVTWLKVEYSPKSRWEKLPVLRNNWSLRGSLKARLAVGADKRRRGRKPDLYLFHTQVISLLSVGWLPGKAPVIVSLDATPLNYDRVGQAYGHKAGNPWLERFKFWLNRRAFHKANYLITWSEWARQSLIRDYGVAPGKVEVIPPGTNLAFWQEAAVKRDERNPGKLNILFVGGDFERKGGRLLYEIFQKSLSDRFELHLVTKGEVAESEGVHVYRNVQPNTPALQALFAHADVFVLPTEGDCLPVAITEAMAAGLPVISTRVGAIEEAVKDGENGFLIAPGDGKALRAALNLLAGEPELRQRMGHCSRERADESFDAAKNGQRLLEICKKLKVT